MIMPVFVALILAIVEFGHATMIRALVLSTAKDAARFGAVGEITTEQVREYIETRLGAALDVADATVLIRDASVIDTAEEAPSSLEFSSLPEIELAEADSRQLFVVSIEVPYEATAIFPPVWTTGMVVTGESIVRHE